MRKLFSTEHLSARSRYRTWQEITREHFVPTEQRKLGDGPFAASLEYADVGPLQLTRSSFGALRTEGTPLTIRQHGRQDTLAVIIRLAGKGHVGQYDRTVVQRPGDLTVLDSNAPFVMEFPSSAASLLIRLPREKLERMLGSVRLYAALTVSGDLPGTTLARTFFDELVRVHEGLSPDMTERMATIGVDLLVASIAERMAQETPKPLQGTVIVQRAKAYVEEHLGDPTLDPPRLAAAMGISLRRLQELFHERGRHVSDWIWTRRLEVAAQRLADPGQVHVSIGALSYGCGFTTQAHFSKRFRDRFGLSPSEHRRAALLSAARAATT